ncbi:hypothetical protein N7461_001863 [Penicillium sp. DV-2018c]|nr:hypothetical protein N7461_001863 [Penicillium sp. DV-2018c]
MRTLSRAIATVLLVALFTWKIYFDLISQWHVIDDLENPGEGLHVLNGDVNIELVSRPIATPTTRKRWLPTIRPASRLVMDESEPKRIPVDVPVADWDTQDAFLAIMRQQMLSDLQISPAVQEVQKIAPSSTAPPRPKVTPKSDRVIVLGRMSYEDTDWLEEQLPEWQHAVYIMDDPEASLSVEQNKGKESNAYLQYILDNYHKLPDYMVFLHAHQYSHHVEFWEQDNVLTVKRLQLDHLRQVGYLNLRCEWTPGCPDEVQPFRQTAGRTTELAFAGAWLRIFNNTDVPEVVATPCCAQFAVTREQVLQRPRSDYESYHRWLMTTELDDETSGRVFEYLWHIIFGQDSVFCPSKAQCYKDVYDMDYEDPVESLFGEDPWEWMSEIPSDVLQ